MTHDPDGHAKRLQRAIIKAAEADFLHRQEPKRFRPEKGEVFTEIPIDGLVGDRPVKTSESHPIRIDWILDSRTWRLGLTLAPGKVADGINGPWKRNLDSDLARLQKLGATVLVSLIGDAELQMLRIPELLKRARELGLQLVRFPFPDGGVPASLESLDGILQKIGALLKDGEGVVVHCRGGLARAGLVGACELLRLRVVQNPEEAIEWVRKRRSRRAIETIEQERFVARYADWLQKKESRDHRR